MTTTRHREALQVIQDSINNPEGATEPPALVDFGVLAAILRQFADEDRLLLDLLSLARVREGVAKLLTVWSGALVNVSGHRKAADSP